MDEFTAAMKARGFVREVNHHGRTASYPAAPVQIPACGTTARGSSKLLALHNGRTTSFHCYSEAVAYVWSREFENLYQFRKPFPVIAASLTATI